MAFSQLAEHRTHERARNASVPSERLRGYPADTLTFFPPLPSPGEQRSSALSTENRKEPKIDGTEGALQKHAELQVPAQSSHSLSQPQFSLRVKPHCDQDSAPKSMPPPPPQPKSDHTQPGRLPREKTSAPTTFPMSRDGPSDIRKKPIESSQDCDHSLQGLKGESRKYQNCTEQSKLNNLPQQSRRENPRPVSTVSSETSLNSPLSGRPLSTLSPSPGISSRPSLAQSVESALLQARSHPSPLSSVIKYELSQGSCFPPKTSLQPESPDLKVPSISPARLIHSTLKSPSLVIPSDSNPGYLPGKSLNSVDDDAVPLAIIPKLPCEDVAQSAPSINFPPGKARRSSRLMIEPSLPAVNELQATEPAIMPISQRTIPTMRVESVSVKQHTPSQSTALRSHPPGSTAPQITTALSSRNQKSYPDSSSPTFGLKSQQSGNGLDTKSGSGSGSGSGGQIRRLSPGTLKSNTTHKPSLHPLKMEFPSPSPRRGHHRHISNSKMVVRDENSSSDEEEDSDDGRNVEDSKSHQPAQGQVQRQGTSVKVQHAPVPQTPAQAQHASAVRARRDLLPPWAVGSAALSARK